MDNKKKRRITLIIPDEIFDLLERESFSKFTKFSALITEILKERYETSENRHPKIPRMPNEAPAKKTKAKKKAK